MGKLGKEIVKVFTSLKKSKISVDDLMEYKPIFQGYYNEVIQSKSADLEELKACIMVCLDCYAYSLNGDVLISDREYDNLMRLYESLTGEKFIYADNVQTSWNMVSHTAPFMVGSVSKEYSFDSLMEALRNHTETHQHYSDNKVTYTIAPKYDGISSCIEFNDGKLIRATTRGDGLKGQDITKVIERCSNIDKLLKGYNGYKGYLKVELCVSTEDFDDIVKPARGYANRRAASSAIINTPKNLDIAHAITAIPLLAYISKKNEDDYCFEYIPPYSETITVRDDILRDRELIEEKINNMLKVIKSPDFPYRVDGVVLRLNSENYTMGDANLSKDAMHYSVAYKVNTQSAQTQIEFAYPSIGRTGLATPMLRVKPCDVNETVVTDVSVSSFKKFNSFGFRENETITIFSAGDVIPQVDPYGFREAPKGAKLLKITTLCPYCNSRLEEVYNEDDADVINLYCRNPQCPRIVAGRITNFCTKLGCKNISDGIIEKLTSNKLIRNIEDLFDLTQFDIAKLDSFGEVSANNIISEIEKIKTMSIPVSKFFGALGIPNISEKKCRNVFKKFDINDILDTKPVDLKWALYDVDGFKGKSIDTFVEFVTSHKSEIRNLMNEMNITKDVKVLGNVVFTGFRNFDLAEKIQKLNYEVSENINKDTVAVIAASTTSGKAKKAKERGIPMYLIGDSDKLLESLKENR